MSPSITSSNPAVWVSRFRSVIGWSKLRGTSKSRYSPTSVSRSTSPRSTSCITAVAVKSLDTEPGRNSVLSGSTGTASPLVVPMSEWP
jgi:hypothetical protein